MFNWLTIFSILLLLMAMLPICQTKAVVKNERHTTTMEIGRSMLVICHSIVKLTNVQFLCALKLLIAPSLSILLKHIIMSVENKYT